MTRLGELVGNQAARDGLLAAIARGRLPHALLLHGPAGVGKREIAEALASAVLCPNAAPDACAACDACRRVAAGVHPDLHRLEPDGRFIKVEAIRDLVRESGLRPYAGVAKVFLVYDADRCHEDAANILLKTLEEPPSQTLIVLVSTARDRVLPTLRSRCQNVALHVRSREEIATLLRDRHELSAAEADQRARRSGGSETAALALDLALTAELHDQAMAALLPVARAELRDADAERILKLAENVARKDGPFDAFVFEVLRPLVRDALVIANGGSVDLLMDPARLGATTDLADALGATGAAMLLKDIEVVEADLVVNVNKRLAIEALFLGVYERQRTR